MKLNHLSNEKLIQNTKHLVLNERSITTEILHHLKEIANRKLYLELGYTSLYVYVTIELGYSPDAAFRRIKAMGLIKSLPQVESKIADGSLSLTAACKIQTFLQNQKKNPTDDLKTVEQKLAWIETLENKSTRFLEKEFVKINPEALTQEKVRPLTVHHHELKITISNDLKNQLDNLKIQLSHVNPNMNYQELIQHLANMATKKLDKSAVTSQRKSPWAPNADARYIPTHIRREVFLRDGGCCAFVNPQTKQKCGSRFQIETDHIRAFALGGKTETKNLRLLCRNHNQHESEKIFGKVR